jgi:class 3 adenylate cyclase
MNTHHFLVCVRHWLKAGSRLWILVLLALYLLAALFRPDSMGAPPGPAIAPWALHLPSPEGLLPASPFRFLADGLMIGGIFVLGAFNLALFAAEGDRSHLWFACFAVAAGMYVLGIRDYLQAALWPDAPAWDDVLSWCLLAAIFFWFIRFSQAYLQTRRHSGSTHSLLNVLAVLMLTGPLIGAPLIGLGWRTAGYAWNILWILVIFVAVMAAAIRGCRRRQRSARTYLVGNACFCAGGALHALGLMGIIDSRDVYAEMVVFGMMVQVLIFSLGITGRIARLKRRLFAQRLETERRVRQAMEAQNRDLEARVAARTADLEREKMETERLLHNMLPRDIAREIRRTGTTAPRRHDAVSILFTDFEGFTPTVGAMPAGKLVEELNRIFSAFDDIIDHHGLEKIKTIGDGIQAASGLSGARNNHAAACVRAGLAMLAHIQAHNRGSAVKWRMRIGVHSGAVVAGVVGKRKFSYDIWGDTVNIASRMENAADPGLVNISAYTYDLVREEFTCEYRGKIEVKGKGRLDMYHVLGPCQAQRSRPADPSYERLAPGTPSAT